MSFFSRFKNPSRVPIHSLEDQLEERIRRNYESQVERELNCEHKYSMRGKCLKCGKVLNKQ